MRTFRKPMMVLALAAYLAFFLSSPALAGMVGSISSSGLHASELRSTDIVKVQAALENELVRAKLGAYGLTAEEISRTLDSMTDGQIHLLAQASDDILAGGNGMGFVIGVLLIVVLVLVILKLMGKTVVIR